MKSGSRQTSSSRNSQIGSVGDFHGAIARLRAAGDGRIENVVQTNPAADSLRRLRQQAADRALALLARALVDDDQLIGQNRLRQQSFNRKRQIAEAVLGRDDDRDRKHETYSLVLNDY